MSVRMRSGGDPDGDVLLLLHGLAGTGAVWDGLTARLQPHWHWLAPDLPGHGGSPPPPGGYSFGNLAAEVARALDRGRPIAVLGHSLGGAVGLAMASGWFGVDVRAVCGLGIKVRWSDNDVAQARAQAAKPPKTFATRSEALARALKVSGLTGLAAPDSAAATTAVAVVDGTWQLAVDPKAYGVGVPDMTGLLAAARAEVTLAAGERDAMGPPEHLRDLVPDPVVLPGVGHNAHVQDPAALDPLLERLKP